MIGGLIIIPMLLIVLLIGAVLLRAAVSLSNKVLGPQRVTHEPQLPIGPPGTIGPPATTTPEPRTPDPAFDLPSTETGNPYATPSAYALPVASSTIAKKAIPEPDFGKAIGIVFLQGIATGILNFVIGAATQGDPIGAILSFVLGFLITVGIYTGMLPTSFGKASLVYVFQILIGIIIAIAIVAVIFAVSAVAG